MKKKKKLTLPALYIFTESGCCILYFDPATSSELKYSISSREYQIITIV